MRLAATLIAFLALAAPASAAWRTEVVPGPGGLGVTSLGFDGRGYGVGATEGFSGGRRVTGIFERPARSTWRRTETLIGWGNAHALPYAATRRLLVRLRQYATGRFNRARFELGAAFGTTGGTPFFEARVLDRDVSGPWATVNPRGDALVAWEKGDYVRIAERAAGRSFGRPRTLSPGGAGRPAVAVNARGDRVVAWYRRGSVEARIRRAGGSWGSVLRAGPAPILPSDIAATVGPTGRLIIAWGARSASVVDQRVAFRNRTGGWRSGTLDRFPRGEFRADPLALPRFDAGGRALIAWVGPLGDDRVVKVGQIAGTEVRRIATLPASAGDGLADFAVGGSRLGLLAYTQETRALTATLGEGGTFGAPEPLTAPGESAVTPARLAFAPDGGEPVALFGASTATGTTLRSATPVTP